MAKSEIIEKENCRRVLKVEIPASEVKAEFDKAYKDMMKNTSVPGFRKGKVPLSIIKSRYEEPLKREVMHSLIRSSLYEAIKEKDLEVLSEPLVEQGELRPEEDFSYKVTVEVRPEIKLGAYHKFSLTRKIKKIAQEDIDRTLKEIQERFARYITIEGKDLSPQDYAQVDIKITDGEKKVLDREGIIVYIDDEGFGRGFSEKVSGLKSGEEREFTLNVPIGGEEETIEKEMDFRIKLREIKERRLPLIDDELARDMGLNTLEELKADIQKRLETSEELRAYQEMRNQIDEELLKRGELVLPEGVVKGREGLLMEEVRRNMELEGKKNEYETKKEEIRKGVREGSIKRIKLAYLLDEIGRREKIDASKEELEDDLKNLFGHNEQYLAGTRKKLEDEKEWDDYALRVREKKIYKYLMDVAEIQTQERRE